MKYFVFLISSLIIFSCSKIPSDAPIDSSRSVEFNVDMNKAIDDGLFELNTDTLTLFLDSSDEFVMSDDNDDNIFSCTISNLILGRTYEYQYAINDVLENLDGERLFTVNDDNLISDYYGELNPTIIIFLVNMSHQIELGNFDPDTQFLDVAGTFNNWGETDSHLADIDNSIYTITITEIEVDDEIEFKFRIDGDWNNSEFPGYGDNRSYTVEQGENVLEFWYNDDDGN